MTDYTRMSDAEAIAIIRRNHQCDEAEAYFILRIERGEIDGNIVSIDANGNEQLIGIGEPI